MGWNCDQFDGRSVFARSPSLPPSSAVIKHGADKLHSLCDMEGVFVSDVPVLLFDNVTYLIYADLFAILGKIESDACVGKELKEMIRKI